MKKIKSIFKPENYSPDVTIKLHCQGYEEQRKKDLFHAFGAIIFVIVVLIITFLIITK